MSEPFERIYAENLWRGEESRSGPGSDTKHTRLVAQMLPWVVTWTGASSVLDVPCGDSFWLPDLPCHVIGVDIVEEAVRVSQERHPDRRYLVADARRDEMPKADFVFSRDFLHHLSLADGEAVMQNFRRTGARWLMASTYVGGENRSIKTGWDYYPVNMTAPPFNLGTPALYIPDGFHRSRETKMLGLWEL